MNAQSKPRIDWSLVEQARARARVERAEAIRRILVVPLASLARRAFCALRARLGLAPTLGRRPCIGAAA